MKILLVNQCYYPFVGGVEVHMRQVAYYLAQRHQVHVAAFQFQNVAPIKRLEVLQRHLLLPTSEDFQDGPITVHSLAPKGLDRAQLLPLACQALPKVQRYFYHELQRFGYFFYRGLFLQRLLAIAEGCSVIHMFGHNYPAQLCLEVTRQLGCALVVTPFAHPGQWGDDLDNVTLYNQAQAVIALLSSDRDNLIAAGVQPQKISTIGVSPQVTNQSSTANFRKQQNLENAPIILFLGRMTPYKGYRILLAAMSRVWATFPAAHAVFAGPLTAEAQADFQQVDPRIVVLGPVTEEVKRDLLASCTIFCMPSISEILPTVYLEAWNFRKPIIAGTAPGLYELVEGNRAGKVVPQEEAKLAETINLLLGNSALAAEMGNNGYALVQMHYSTEAVGTQIENLYRSVIKVTATI